MLVGGIMMMTVLSVLVERGYQRETVDPWTLKARTKTWALGFHQVLQHPIVGIGYGNETFLRMYHAEVEAEKNKGAVEKVLPALHSTFLMILVGSGVPAFFFFAWAMGRLYQNLVSGARTSTSLPSRILLFSITAALVGFIVRNCFDYMFAGSLAHLFWILMATGYALKAEQ
jgi:putative inorganic carbon (HCO3(-)) transporter